MTPLLRSRLAAALALAALLSGCRVPARVATPAARPLPAAYAPTTTAPDSLTVAATAPTDSSTAADWLVRRFFAADSVLVALLDTALRQNPDLAQAAARVAQARAELVGRRGALLPTVSAVTSAGLDRYGRYTQAGVGNFDTNFSPNIDRNQAVPNPVPDYFAGLRATWEVDLWGKLRARRHGAYLRLLATERGRQLVQTDLIAEVARTYYEMLALDQELEIFRRNATLQARSVEISVVLKRGGRSTELAVQQFVAQQRRTESLEAAAQQRLTETENRLNRLLGRFPQAVSRGRPLLRQTLPANIHAGVPAALLRRRPDVRQAEADLLANRADVTAARAAFRPSLILTPYAGLNAFRASVFFNPESLALGILGSLTAPALNRAALRADYGAATAREVEAWYAFRETTLRGVEEVVTHLRGLDRYGRAADLRAQEVAALNRAVSVSDDLFRAGYASYLEVITAQRTVLDSELELVNARRAQFDALIGLYRALGGGWTAAAVEAEKKGG